MTSEQINFLKTAFHHAEAMTHISDGFKKISEGDTINSVVATYKVQIDKFDEFVNRVACVKYHISEYEYNHCEVYTNITPDKQQLDIILDNMPISEEVTEYAYITLEITADDRYADILNSISDKITDVKTWCALANEQTAAQTSVQILSEMDAENIKVTHYSPYSIYEKRLFTYREATCIYKGAKIRASGHGKTEAMLALLRNVVNYKEPYNDLYDFLFGK